MRLNALTSLRFFAAMGVFLHHFHFFEHTNSALGKLIYSIFYEGFIGVTFFYVLSGFIISYSYDQHKKRGSYKVKDFLRNRVSRLYPTHLLTLLIACVVYLNWQSFISLDFKSLLANALLVQSAVADQNYYFGFNGVSWSVSTEMFFYVSFIFLVTLNNIQLIVVGSALLAAIVFHLVGIDHSSKYIGWMFYINPAFRVIDFIVGMLLFKIYSSGKINIGYAKGTVLEILSLLSLVAFAFVGVKYIPMTWRFDIYYLIPMSAMVFIFALGSGAISKAISIKPLVLLGEASFSLYMIHQIIINISVRFFSPYVNLDSMKSVMLLILPTVVFGIFVSIIMYKLYEKPLNNYFRGERKKRLA